MAHGRQQALVLGGAPFGEGCLRPHVMGRREGWLGWDTGVDPGHCCYVFRN